MERVQWYKEIRADTLYNIKVSDGRGEGICVKKLVSLKGIPNYLSKMSTQWRYDGSRAGWRVLMIEFDGGDVIRILLYIPFKSEMME